MAMQKDTTAVQLSLNNENKKKVFLINLFLKQSLSMKETHEKGAQTNLMVDEENLGICSMFSCRVIVKRMRRARDEKQADTLKRNSVEKCDTFFDKAKTLVRASTNLLSCRLTIHW